MCISAAGHLTVWNITKAEEKISTSIHHLLRPESNDVYGPALTIVGYVLRPEGLPVLRTSLDETFTYHIGMRTFVRVGNRSRGVVLDGKKGDSTVQWMGEHVTSLSEIEVGL